MQASGINTNRTSFYAEFVPDFISKNIKTIQNIQH